MALLVLLALAAAGAWSAAWLWRRADVGAAFKAKTLCSAIFVSGRPLDLDRADEVSAESYSPLRLFRATLDGERREVAASLLGLRGRRAVFRPGLGATLALGPLQPVAAPQTPFEPPNAAAPWPEGDAPAARETAALARAIDAAFLETDARFKRRTRAVIVASRGRLTAERYAEGFSPATPLPGWSMTKSVMAALIGSLIGDGRLSLNARRLLPEWSAPADGRGEISLEDLLRMRSGLKFSEVYDDPGSDVVRMLFAEPDMSRYAASRPLAAPPGSVWQYASGTTNILSLLARRALGEADYGSLPRRALFEPLGMRSAVLEPDASGTFVGSSFLHACARDWARFGQLFVQDGVWEGRRLLPEGWSRFSRDATPQSQGRYGAHWWLKLPAPLGGDTKAAARLPADAYHALGHEGQCLTIVPSRQLVVVRLGLSIHLEAWDHARFLADLLDAGA